MGGWRGKLRYVTHPEWIQTFDFLKGIRKIQKTGKNVQQMQEKTPKLAAAAEITQVP